MNKRRSNRIYLYVSAVVAIGVGVLFLVATTYAPTTEGLVLHALSHPGTAAAGNRNEASLLVSAYNAAGPIRGVPGGSFSIVVAASPAGATPIAKVAVSEVATGIYRITVAPERSQDRWSAGLYVLGITLTSPNGSGVVVAELQIAP